MRRSLAARLVIWLIAGIGVAFVLQAVLTTSLVHEAAVREVGVELRSLVVTASQRLEPGDLQDIAASKDAESPAFSRARALVATAAAANALRFDQLYVLAPVRERTLSFVVMLHTEPFVGQNYHVPEALWPIVERAIATGESQVTPHYVDAHGSFVSAMSPVRSADGKVVALLWADRPYDTVRERAAMNVKPLLALQGVIVAALFAWIIAHGWRLRRRLRALIGAMEEVRRGDPTSLPVQGDDELAFVAQSTNELLLSHVERDELARFVPLHAREYATRKTRGTLRRASDDYERLVVVTMFSDLRGFTRLAERMSPEASIDLINRVLSLQVSVVEQHDGRVQKFLGDGLMVTFEGARHAERAFAAAGGIQTAVSALELETGPVAVGIGLTLGEVVVGTIGVDAFRERAVIGAQVNLAARLCAVAGAGEILMSGAVFEQLRGRLVEAVSREVAIEDIDNVTVYAVAKAAGRDAPKVAHLTDRG